MFKKTMTAVACSLSLLSATAASAAGWTVDSDASVLGFGSIKGNTTGEAHTISGVAGKVAADGTATLTLDLTTIQTNIDIRNERIGEHIFKGAANATLTAAIDLEAMEGLAVGEYMVTEVEGDLALIGEPLPVYLDMFIMRTADDQVIATSNSMLFISTEELGIDAGIDVLKALANLDGITRSFPVTMRFVFNADA